MHVQVVDLLPAVRPGVDDGAEAARHPQLPHQPRRQAEHAPDDSKAGAQPIFQYDGRSFVGRFNERLIEAGAELAGAPLDREGTDALEAMRLVVDSPDLWVEFTIDRDGNPL